MGVKASPPGDGVQGDSWLPPAPQAGMTTPSRLRSASLLRRLYGRPKLGDPAARAFQKFGPRGVCPCRTSNFLAPRSPVAASTCATTPPVWRSTSPSSGRGIRAACRADDHFEPRPLSPEPFANSLGLFTGERVPQLAPEPRARPPERRLHLRHLTAGHLGSVNR